MGVDRHEPLVSILSPVYNEELYLGRMLASVVEQDYPKWELLIADDGSDDATAALAEEWASKDPRIRLVAHGTRRGKNASMNIARAAASGDIAFLLAGDDELPPGALRRRVETFVDESWANGSRTSAFFKMRTISEDSKFDGLVLPKGRASSRSGSSPTYTRALMEWIFPIPESLPSEDLWIGFLAEHLADRVHLSTSVGWLYRIHLGNSHPRHRSFTQMSAAIADRMRVWDELQKATHLPLPEGARRQISINRELERLRSEGRPLAMVLRGPGRLVDRLGNAAMSRPALFRVRMRFYRVFTGLRGA